MQKSLSISWNLPVQCPKPVKHEYSTTLITYNLLEFLIFQPLETWKAQVARKHLLKRMYHLLVIILLFRWIRSTILNCQYCFAKHFSITWNDFSFIIGKKSVGNPKVYYVVLLFADLIIFYVDLTFYFYLKHSILLYSVNI